MRAMIRNGGSLRSCRFMPPAQVEEAPPVRTGNEATLAELEALGESFDQPPEQAELSDAEQDLSGG